MRKPMTVLVTGIALLGIGSVAAREQADDLLAQWTQYVDQQVTVDGCYLTAATQTNVYCDTVESGQRLYVDIASFDPASLQQAVAACYGYDPVPQCRVAMTGTLRASFGSPQIHDAVASFNPPASVATLSEDGALGAGEYACYGSGGSILIGLGFIVEPDGRYTDLDRTTEGTVSVAGNQVQFSGGHLDGETGRDLTPAGAFVIGDMASCEPW